MQNVYYEIYIGYYYIYKKLWSYRPEMSAYWMMSAAMSSNLFTLALFIGSSVFKATDVVFSTFPLPYGLVYIIPILGLNWYMLFRSGEYKEAIIKYGESPSQRLIYVGYAVIHWIMTFILLIVLITVYSK